MTAVAVVDASVVVDALVGEGRGVELMEGVDLLVPHLLDAEVTSVLRRATREGRLTARSAVQALDDLMALELQRFSHVPLLPRAWELRENLTVYDALYVALAERMDVPLVTLDARLAAAPGIRAVIVMPPAR